MVYTQDKCIICNKKLGLLPYVCKCGNITCVSHQWPNHECSYNYKKVHKELLEHNNPKIVPSKINLMT
jgi:AN1-type zinc finger protein 5/6